MLEYPAQSMDLNPIENLQNHLKRSIRECKPSNLEEPEVIVKEEWRNIPQTIANDCIQSSRIQVILSTPYTTDG